ncbi:hypothetical protein EDD64_11214 [Effusibacillus lacus]|nr:hypothetical protein EDD64_11214 [Effusibacillus lacus]
MPRLNRLTDGNKRVLYRRSHSWSDLLETKPIFRRHPEPATMTRLFELKMVEKHIERLVREGRVRRENDWNEIA